MYEDYVTLQFDILEYNKSNKSTRNDYRINYINKMIKLN